MPCTMIKRWRRDIAGALVAASVGLLADTARAQTTSPSVSPYLALPHPAVQAGATTVAEQGAPAATDRTGAVGGGEWVLAPMPMINPTLDNGGAVAIGYLYRLNAADQATPPSLSMASGFATSNSSWGVAGVQTLHLGNDRVRLLMLGSYADVHYDFFGIGQSVADASRPIELNQRGPVALADALVRLRPHWYIGARYKIMKMTVTTPEVALPDGLTISSRDADMRTAGLGPRLELDSRDSLFYPTSGSQLNLLAGFHGNAVGGVRTYQVYEGWLNRYHAVGSRDVVAWHVGACGAAGDAPFYDLCLLGKNQDVRGYPVGQFRDRVMLASQVEWRTQVWSRLGGVVFAGLGTVGPSIQKVALDETLPGAGLGLRIMLARRNHVNLRVDYAWGRRSRALYIGVGEAF